MKHASQCGVGSNINKSTNVIINTLQYFTMVTSFQMEKKQLLLVNNFVLLFFFLWIGMLA